MSTVVFCRAGRAPPRTTWGKVMELLRSKWNPFSGIRPLAVESSMSKWRQIMCRLSAATQPPRLNKVSTTARTINYRSTKTVTIPHVGQETILALFAPTIGTPDTTTILPEGEERPRAPGSTTVQWTLTAGDTVARVIRLEESVQSVAKKAFGSAKVTNAGGQPAVAAILPPVKITHVERRDALGIYSEDLTFTFRCATISISKQPQVTLPPDLRPCTARARLVTTRGVRARSPAL